MLNREYYEEYVKVSKLVWDWLVSKSNPNEQVVNNICTLRKYEDPEMVEELQKIGFVFIPETVDVSILKDPKFSKLGLFTQTGRFLLTNRYMFPVKDMLGNILAFIGWYPDEKRYITTPSELFMKDCLFFGLDQLSNTGINKKYILVEGIFDSISVRSIGYNCIAQMGSSTSPQKEVLYGLFSRLLGIPDADKTGREVVSKDKWRLPANSSYVVWYQNREKIIKVGQEKGVKDIDDLIKLYGADYARELIDDAMQDRERVVSYKI